jgi:pimeloyl-ACP methyl ester carboxylesterase
MRATVFLLASALTGVAIADKPAPPQQPASGPGGAEYAHAGYRETQHGSGGGQFWILEPADPKPEKAPLVIFLHGWSAMTPDTYRGWVVHLARRGSIVVYPRYQEGLLAPATEYFPNVVSSVREALSVLGQPGRVQPDLEKIAVVGHSAGGVQAANYCIHAAAEGLPFPKAAMFVEPGQGPDRGLKIVPLDDCGKIPAETRMLVVIGDSDGIVGTGCARTIWRDTKHVRDRSFVTVQSDDHGTPPLRANHLSPVSWTPEATDAIDWLGYWRMLDGLMSAAFAGRNCTVDPDMGNWSDGTPVKPLKIER